MATTGDIDDAKKCFLWCILAALRMNENLEPYTTFEQYKRDESKVNTDGILWPMTIEQMPKFERQNPQIALTVLLYEEIEPPPWVKARFEDREQPTHMIPLDDLPPWTLSKMNEEARNRHRQMYSCYQDMCKQKKSEEAAAEIQKECDLLFFMTTTDRNNYLSKKLIESRRLKNLEKKNRTNKLNRRIKESVNIRYNSHHDYRDSNRFTIDLLLIEHREDNCYDWAMNSHFVLIRDLGRLIRFYGYKKKRVCRYCLQGFKYQRTLETHLGRCRAIGGQKVKFPDEKILKFSSFEKMVQVPYIISVDFEAFIQKVEKPVSVLRKAQSHLIYDFVDKSVEGKTDYTFEHKMCGYSWIWVKSEGELVDKQTYHLTLEDEAAGVDVAVKCLNEIAWVGTQKVDEMKAMEKKARKDPESMKMLFNNLHPDNADQTVCWFCDKYIPQSIDELEILDTDDREADESKRYGEWISVRAVRHHDHFSREFVGWAHSHCNLQAEWKKFVPVICHNLTNYDGHAFVRAFEKAQNVRKMDVIPVSTEKFMGLVVNYIDVVFLDSLKFMSASLAKLVDMLAKSGKDKFKLLKDMVKNKYDLHEDNLDLLLRKGVYCYERMTRANDFELTELPPREQFFSQLTGEGVSQEDYRPAKLVWDIFGCKTMADYHDLYVETDVRQLMDIFLSWRQLFLDKFKIDCCHYWSLPGLSWDCALKNSKVELEYIKNIHMHLFVEQALRGGLACGGSLRYAKANNPYSDTWDKTKPNSYIQYIDMNSLYPTALSQKLPIGDFKFLNFKIRKQSFRYASHITNIDSDRDKG